MYNRPRYDKNKDAKKHCGDSMSKVDGEYSKHIIITNKPSCIVPSRRGRQVEQVLCRSRVISPSKVRSHESQRNKVHQAMTHINIK